MTVRTLLVTAHDRWCRPWMVPVLTIIGVAVWVVTSVMAFHDAAGGIGVP